MKWNKISWILLIAIVVLSMVTAMDYFKYGINVTIDENVNNMVLHYANKTNKTAEEWLSKKTTLLINQTYYDMVEQNYIDLVTEIHYDHNLMVEAIPLLENILK